MERLRHAISRSTHLGIRRYWIGRVAGSDYLYACWWDKRAGKTRRRSLATKVLAEAQDWLIKLAGSSRTNASRSPDAVLLMAALWISTMRTTSSLSHRPS